MKKLKLGAATIGLALGLGSMIYSAQGAEGLSKSDEKPGVVEAVTGSFTAIVDKIDYETRELTLKGSEGEEKTITAGPDVVRFNEIKKGDTVTVDFAESVVILVQSPDAKVASAEGSNALTIRNKGKKPSGTMIKSEIVTATVVSIDAKNRSAVLTDPKGKDFKVKIAPDVENLENIKKGDLVQVKHTKIVAIAVNKPSAK